MGALTEDHIPPKGASRLQQVKMMHIVDMLSLQRPNRSTRYAQRGVKYRTLCGQCNNERLGHRYDPTLIALARDVRRLLESKLLLPPQIEVITKPNRLLRSVIGHLLAFGVGQHRDGGAINGLTDFFLDESGPFPADIKLYYWLYPFNDQVLIRHAGVSFHYRANFAPFMLLKFFPLAFFLVINEPPTWRLRHRRADLLMSSDIDRDVPMAVELHEIPHQRWPEAPGDEGIVLYGDGATGAIPRLPGG